MTDGHVWSLFRGGSPLKAILHIGDAKCGSSSIQASLHAARGALLDHGILYHSPRPTNGHFSYITLLGGKTRGDDTQQASIARENIQQTRELIRIHSPEYLAISGESLFSARPDALWQLLSEIDDSIEEAHVVAFLRHPVDLYLSMVQQTLKANHEFSGPVQYRRDTPATFRKWLAHDRCASVTVALFDRSAMKNGSVVSEFSEIFRTITGTNLLSLPEYNENFSLSAEQMIALQKLRALLFPEEKGMFKPASNQLVGFFEELNGSAGRLIKSKPTLTADVEACIFDRNLEYIEQLDELFPSLGMKGSRSVEPRDWQLSQARWTADVSSILANWDPETVTDLMRMIPTFEPSLGQGMPTPALQALYRQAGSGKGREALVRYFKRSGLHEAVAEIRARGRAAS